MDEQNIIDEQLRRKQLQDALFGKLNYSPLPEQPQVSAPEALYKPGPAMQAYEAKINAMPQPTEPSRIRKFGATLAGIGAGLNSGPQAADQTKTNFEMSPYRHAMEMYNPSLVKSEQLAKMEVGQQAQGQKYLTDLSLIRQRNERAQAEAARARAEGAREGFQVWRTGPQAHQYNIEELRVRHPTDLYTVVDVTGKSHSGRFDENGNFHAGDKIIPEDQIDFKKTQKMGVTPAKITNPFQLWQSQNPNEPVETWLEDQEKRRPGSKDRYNRYRDSYLAEHPDADEPEILRNFARDAQAPQRPITMVLPGGNAIGVTPGAKVPEGAQTPQQVGQENTTTSATKTMMEAAPKVIDLSNRVEQEINKQLESLGPASGRWSEFMTGKVGAPNREFAKLRTDVMLLQTLLMRMHVGARGGQLMMEHFKNLIDVAGQDPENLKGALEEIRNYAHDLNSKPALSSIKNTPKDNSLPGGITLDEVNAEIERRKKK